MDLHEANIATLQKLAMFSASVKCLLYQPKAKVTTKPIWCNIIIQWNGRVKSYASKRCTILHCCAQVNMH